MDAEKFWKKVKLLLNEKNKNQEWLCEKTGIILSTLRNKIHLDRMPTLEETLKILKLFNLSMEEFLVYPEKIQKNILNIPVYEQAFSAGKGQFIPDSADILEYVSVPSDLKKYAENLRAAYVRGDSMEPTLFDGDRIIFDDMGYDGQDGIYAVIYNGSGFVKRLQKRNDSLRIISDNKIYAPIEEASESENFTIIGKVRYVIHKLQG
ncbi:MAG: helix-turn-helix transcriptional regulator [Treponema sp.]|nr:helix-turn-helix transcriptional regulator [Treponema sp.]